MFGVNNGLRQLLLDSQKPLADGGGRERWAEAFADLRVSADEINGYIQRMGLGERFVYNPIRAQFIEIVDPAARSHNREQLIEAWQINQMLQMMDKVFPGVPHNENDQLTYITQKFWKKFLTLDQNGLIQPVSASIMNFAQKIEAGTLKDMAGKTAARLRKQEPFAIVPLPGQPHNIVPRHDPNPFFEREAFLQQIFNHFMNPQIPQEVRDAQLAFGAGNLIGRARVEEVEENAHAEDLQQHEAALNQNAQAAQAVVDDNNEVEEGLGDLAAEMQTIRDQIAALRGQTQDLIANAVRRQRADLQLVRSRKEELETKIKGIQERTGKLLVSGALLATTGPGLGAGGGVGIGALASALPQKTLACFFSVLPITGPVVIGVAAIGAAAGIASAIVFGVMAGEEARGRRLKGELDLSIAQFNGLEAELNAMLVHQRQADNPQPQAAI